jgi:hypothetical protein
LATLPIGLRSVVPPFVDAAGVVVDPEAIIFEAVEVAMVVIWVGHGDVGWRTWSRTW